MPRRSSVGSSVRTLRPSMRTSPDVSSTSRLTSFIAVVLPPPEGPTSTQICPAGIANESRSTAGVTRPA